MKHTPGPWTFEDRGEGKIINVDGELICTFGNDLRAYPSAGIAPEEENLNLILAAPEMYETLKKCMTLFALGGLALQYVKKKPEVYEEKRAKAREIEHEIMAIISKVEGAGQNV